MTKIIDVEQNDLFGVWYFQCLSLLNRPKTCIFQTLTQSQQNPQMCFLKGLRTLYNEAGWADCVLETVIIGKRDRYHSVCVCMPSEGGISLRGNVPLGSVNHHRTPTLLSSPTSDCEPVRTDHLIQAPQGERETDWGEKRTGGFYYYEIHMNSFNISIFKLSITCCTLDDTLFFSLF